MLHYVDMLKRTLLDKNYLEHNESFHIARCELSSRSPDFVHDHDFFEMFYVETGSVNHHVNGQLQRLDTGTIVFIRPTDSHALWSNSAKATIVNLLFTADTALHISSRYHAQFADHFFWSNDPFPRSLNLKELDQQRLLKDLMHLIAGPRLLAHVEGFLTQFLVSRTNEEQHHSTLPSWLRDGLSRASEPHVIKQGARGLSAACGRSHEHVSRVVKQHLSMTASEIMNGRRMVHAAKLLVSTDSPITEIAQVCGVENTSYFYRMFKDFHGMTPKAYREINRRNPIDPGDLRT